MFRSPFGVRGGALEEARLEASLQSEWYSETRDLRLDIAKERADKRPNTTDILELQEKIDEVREDIYENDEVIEDFVDAQVAQKNGASNALNMSQWFLRLKIFLDLFKIIAVILLIIGSLGLVRDSQADNTTRWFAIGTTGVVLFSILANGIWSFLA